MSIVTIDITVIVAIVGMSAGVTGASAIVTMAGQVIWSILGLLIVDAFRECRPTMRPTVRGRCTVEEYCGWIRAVTRGAGVIA
jgi:hypothetical protein